jgi:hypothetical protein
MTIEKIRKQWFPLDAETVEKAHMMISKAEEALERAEKILSTLKGA